jgi:hypothetical protein
MASNAKHREERRAEINRGLKVMLAEGQGVYTMTLVSPLTLPFMDKFIIQACGKLLSAIHNAPPPAMCLLCNNEFVPDSPPAQIVVLTAARDDASVAMMHGICLSCEDRGELPARIAAYYRANAISDFRMLPSPSPPGHA